MRFKGECCNQAISQACAVCSPRNRINERFYGDVSITILDAQAVDPDQRRLIQRARELNRSDCSVIELQEHIRDIFWLI
jgi:hypothetical protein